MIDTNLIYAKTKSGFQAKLDASEVKNTSIAFIEDSKEIWTNGQYWPCPYSKEEIDNLISSCTTTEELTSTLADYLTKSDAAATYQVKGDYALSADIPTNVSELTNDSGYLTSIPSTYLQTTNVVDNLTSTSINTPLSANQGKVLNDKITEISSTIPDTEALKTEIVAQITDSAPETLDTLNELAAALGDDPNFATTMTNELAKKVETITASGTIPLILNANKEDSAITIAGSLKEGATSSNPINVPFGEGSYNNISPGYYKYPENHHYTDVPFISTGEVITTQYGQLAFTTDKAFYKDRINYSSVWREIAFTDNVTSKSTLTGFTESTESNENLEIETTDTINQGFGKLQKVTKDSKVILENLKNNLGFEGTNYNLPDLSSTHYLSGCQTIIECLLALDTKLNELEQQLTIKQP